MGDLPTYDDVIDARNKAPVPHFPAIQRLPWCSCGSGRSIAVHGCAYAISDHLVLLGLKHSNSSQKALLIHVNGIK